MKQLSFLALILFGLLACTEKIKPEEKPNLNFSKRQAVIPENDSLISGSTYLALYSQIYQHSHAHTYDLTTTVSIRNISSTDTVFLTKADYYDTHGALLRPYLKFPVYLAPLETIEIVIDEGDQSGGTGANFLFDWKTNNENSAPYMQAVMISTAGQQGLSFTTEGIRR
ncbi:MAG: DUF3124 domain-containing protein [Saprospiraceae bacterium]